MTQRVPSCFPVRALAFVLAVFPAPCLLPMDWPADGGRTAGNFGMNVNGLPQLGVSFEGGNTVRAAEEGELIYLSREGDTASRLPSPLGSWMALDHGDGIISIYSRFDGGSSSPPSPGPVRRGTVLAQQGVSGWSSASGFFFQLFDRKERRWINPAMITGQEDGTLPPAVNQVWLRDGEGNFLELPRTAPLDQGRYTVTVAAGSPSGSPGGSPLAPYRITCSLNGSGAGTLGFEAYSARDGSLMAYRNGLVPVKEVYAPFPRYGAADIWLTRGQSTLEIIAGDTAGNARSAVYRLTVE